MIYLVSENESLFVYPEFSRLSVEESIKMIESWGPIIQWDSETTGRDPHICDLLCTQFGDYNGNEQIVIDNTTISILNYKTILEEKILITVNGAFDCQFAYKYGIIPRKHWDCMVVEQSIFLGYDPKYFHCSFKAIAERRLGIDIDKTTRGEIIWRGLDKNVILYAAGDVTPLGQIRDSQLKDIEQRRIAKAVEIENMFVPVNAYLMWCGIRLDVDKWRIKIKDNEKKRDDALAALNQWVVDYSKTEEWKKDLKEGYYLYEYRHNGEVVHHTLPKGLQPKYNDTKVVKELGETYVYVKCVAIFPYTKVNLQGDLFEGFDTEPKCTINWNSNPQVADFFEMVGFNVEFEDRKTGKMKRTVTAKVIKKQKGIADDLLKVYFEYTEKEKDCSTYGENYIDAINPLTGRIHTTFRQIGASSGRMSCGGGSKSHNTDLAKLKHISPERCNYVQIQNLPSDDKINGIEHYTRTCFIPNEGNLMCSCDYSALESRLGADIYQEESMINEFLHGSGEVIVILPPFIVI